MCFVGGEHQPGCAQHQKRQYMRIVDAQHVVRGFVKCEHSKANPEQVAYTGSIRKREKETEGPGD